MKISVAQNNDKVTFVERELSEISELKDIILKNTYSLSVFKDNYRNKDNFVSAEMIGLDIDEGLSIENAAEIFKEYKHIIAPSKSHRIEKKGKVEDRFRVILFLSKAITDNLTFTSTWYSLFEKCPQIDKACKDSSRYYYPGTTIYSLRLDDGALVDPVQPKKVEKAKPDESKLVIHEGKLSNKTLKFLLEGAPDGQKHNELFLAARDANQNLKTKEWFLNELSNLATKLNEPAYVDANALKTVEDAFSKDPRHEPRLRKRAFSYINLGELLEVEDKPDDWLVEGLLIKGGISIVVGAPKIGKSTLVRQLEKCILKGEEFLERKTSKGSVVHYSFDEKAKTAKRHYKKLGLTKDDKLVLHFGVASNNQYLKELEEDLLVLKPTLAVVDTLFDLIEIEDVNSYAPIKRSLSQLSGLAERTNCHILFIHHQNKPNPNFTKGSGHSILGSTAIFGSVDCCLIFEQVKDSPIRTLVAKGRAVDDFERVQLKFNKELQIYTVETISDIPF